jgi:hypothetical protein
MTRFLVVSLLAVSLQACARGTETTPSYLGLLAPNGAEAAISETMPKSGDPLPELRHVGSNKVLGAMAFQKTTGRAVDPSRLQSSR